MNLRVGIQTLWYQSKLNPLLWPFIPISLLYQLLMSLRTIAYEIGLLTRHSSPIPLIILGNLTVGGTGKTPLVAHIVSLLKQKGFRPGIISRGYGGKHTRTQSEPLWVNANSAPEEVGDEPLLLAKRLACPVVIAAKRVKALQSLLNSGMVDIIVSDDGLQHLALKADIEVLVIDGKRRFGNAWCLPIGPLRESLGRLNTVDFIVNHDPPRFDNDSEYDMELRVRSIYKGLDANQKRDLPSFRGKILHAVAGIGFPERFFDFLRKQGLELIPHPFPDHHRFQAKDIEFNDEHEVLMTEKDAVKCQSWMTEKHWVVSIDAVVNPLFDMQLLKRLSERRESNG